MTGSDFGYFSFFNSRRIPLFGCASSDDKLPPYGYTGSTVFDYQGVSVSLGNSCSCALPLIFLALVRVPPLEIEMVASGKFYDVIKKLVDDRKLSDSKKAEKIMVEVMMPVQPHLSAELLIKLVEQSYKRGVNDGILQKQEEIREVLGMY